MANLKIDLLNKLKNDKYFDESELVRLAQEPNMNYKQKIDEMCWVLNRIVTTNAQIALAEQYFQDAPAKTEGAEQPAPQQPAQQQPAPNNVHQGQTHGE